MNFLSIFVLIPLLMLAGLWAARGIKAIRGVMVTGASALLIASVVLTFLYLGERSAGNTAEMLFRADTLWYAPLHISYSVGVDGISVAMLLLSAVIVFTGTFASWRLQPLTKEYFLWFTLLSMGVFGFFISVDLFTMFMFYEIALIPMYLLIGVWGSGRKEYAAMKLTLMLMGGSAFLLIGILEIYQCLFIRISLRTGSFRYSDAESDSSNRSYPSDAFTRIDDSLILCSYRYDLWTYTHT